LRYRQATIELLNSLEADPNVEIIPLTEDLYARAFRLFRERPDKEWGLTDCISFVVMHERGLIAALTTDEHFQQAGFRALLRE
jgi:predicted nucleic acid-binding protein